MQLANRAASKLIEAGVRPGHIVGLWLPRGIELLVMQLAIAKTGAAWLPLDADTPLERIAVCLDDADAVGIVRLRSARAATGRRSSGPLWTAETLLAAPPRAALHRREGALPDSPGLRDLHLRLHRQAQGHRHHPAQHLPLPAQRERRAGRARGRPRLPGLLGRLRHVLRGDLDQLPGRRDALDRARRPSPPTPKRCRRR